MKIQCWSIGKNNESYIKEGIEDFTRRLSKYFPVEWNLIPTPKNAGMLSEMDLNSYTAPAPYCGMKNTITAKKRQRGIKATRHKGKTKGNKATRKYKS